MKEDNNKELIFCHHFFSPLVTFFSNWLKTKEKTGKPEDLPVR